MEIANGILIFLCFLGIIFLIKNSKKMKAELDELIQKVTAESAGIDSAIELLKGLKTKLDNALDDPEAMVKLRALSKEIGDKTQVLAEAVVASTPTETTGLKKTDVKKK